MPPDIDHMLQKFRIRMVAPLSRVLSGFWSWWTGELVATLPAGARSIIESANKRILITLENSEIVFTEQSDAAERVTGRYPFAVSGESDIVLPDQVSDLIFCLPPDKVLTRLLTLPLAAEENLREVLGFEMDRQTPFTVDQVYYDYYVVERTSSQGSITVNLVVSPKNTVDHLLSGLARTGVTPDVITTREGDNNSTLPINLIPGHKRRRSRFSTQRLNLALTTICVLLFAIALTLPIWQKKQAIEQLGLEQFSAEVLAKNGLALRHEVERRTAISEFLIGKKESSVLVLKMLDEVSRLLPDNTWLYRFNVNRPEIQLQGQSESAAALIQLLESSPLFRNARFRSPVVQVPQTDVERFHVSVELEPMESK